MARRYVKRLALAVAIASVDLLIKLNQQVTLQVARLQRARKWVSQRTNWRQVNSPNYDCVEDVEEFRCPISHQVMRRPVKTPYGHCFEAKAIKKWLRLHCSCPVTRQLLSVAQLTPCEELQQVILQAVLQRQRHPSEVRL